MARLKRILWLIFKWGSISGATAFLLFALWLVFIVKIFELPNFDPYLNYQPYQTSYFLDRDGEIIGCLAKEWRDPIFAAEARELMVAKIILAVEDHRFYERSWGIDAKAIGRAFVKNLMAGRVVEGGSTLEQQLVKHLLRPEERSKRNLGRKIKEAVMAFQLISRFDKDQILALYLSEVYFGGDSEGLVGQVYGVEAASRYYFNKRSQDLTLSEAALLAGIIPAPARFSPKTNPKGALEKRNQVLATAYQENTISKEDYDKAFPEPINVTGDFAKSCQRAQHAVWEARKILRKEHKLYFDAEELVSDEVKTEKAELESKGQNYARLGLRVVMTLDWEVQRLGTEGVNIVLSDYKKRQGDNAIDAEAAFIAIENGTGATLAMVGGSDFAKRKFNHAVQAKRQTGSAFKPIVYVTKFEQELAEGVPYDKLLDQQVSNARLRCPMIRNPKTPEDWWDPRNFDEDKFSETKYPTMTRRFAIAQSVNRPAVHTARVGKCGLNPAIPVMASRLGIGSKIDPYLPSSLGASGISLLELARAYSVFPNQGVKRENYLVSKIVDGSGKIIYEKTSWKSEAVISKVLAGIMVEALRGVVKFGTARSLESISQPTAGKTGTTENYIDAWFVGFTPDITAATWMGGPESYEKPLGDKETGSKVIPAFRHVVENWYKGYALSNFSEESKEYMESLIKPPSFDKEMESLKNGDPDTEAPQ